MAKWMSAWLALFLLFSAGCSLLFDDFKMVGKWKAGIDYIQAESGSTGLKIILRSSQFEWSSNGVTFGAYGDWKLQSNTVVLSYSATKKDIFTYRFDDNDRMYWVVVSSAWAKNHPGDFMYLVRVPD